VIGHARLIWAAAVFAVLIVWAIAATRECLAVPDACPAPAIWRTL